jgi:uncharacterized protein YggE
MIKHSKHRTTTLVTAAMLLASIVAGCSETAQAGGGGQVEARTSASDIAGSGITAYTIVVSGSGMASGRPDVANVQLGVESIHADAGEAVDDNTRRMQTVMQSIRELDLEDEDIQTVNYNMWVEDIFDREGNPTNERRYHVVNQVTIRLRDLDRMGKLLESALAAGANSVGGISFGVSDPGALQQEARDRALGDAKAKAEQMAGALGASLGKIRYVGDTSGLPAPGPVFAAEVRGVGGGGEVPIAAGQFEVAVNIQVIFDISR